MAESVDALVSNTSGATRAGSTPALGTKIAKDLGISSLAIFILGIFPTFSPPKASLTNNDTSF